MPSVQQVLVFGLGLAVTAHALPRIAVRQEDPSSASEFLRSTSTIRESRPLSEPTRGATQEAAVQEGGNGGVTDFDILQFALTLENLEGEFYNQGFAKFQQQDFRDAGLSQREIDGFTSTGQTERVHVQTLTAALSAAGQRPVQKCQYNFDDALRSVDSMISTARVLEAVGVAAYLGAAPLIQSRDILGVAGSIVTIESRHQTFIRSVSKANPIPNAFDSNLSVKQVFTLAAPFIRSCPRGSNLNIQANPAIALTNPVVRSGQRLVLQNDAMPSGARFCAFVDTGKAQYSQLQDGQCQVVPNLTGEVYMMVTRDQSVSDDSVIAGPSVILAT